MIGPFWVGLAQAGVLVGQGGRTGQAAPLALVPPVWRLRGRGRGPVAGRQRGPASQRVGL